MLNLKSTLSLSLRKLRAGSKTFVTILGLVAASALTSHAQLINIAVYNSQDTNYSTGYMSGSAVLGTTPSNTTDIWNTLQISNSNSFTDLTYAGGGSSNVSLSYTGFEGNNFSGVDSVGGLAPALFENFDYEFLGDSGKSGLDFSGLADSTAYKLVLYNLNDSEGTDTTYTVNGTTSTLIQAGNAAYTSTPTTSSVDPGAVYSGNYIELTGTTDSLGNLDISLGVAPSNSSNSGVGASNSFLAFTGLQLEEAQAVPEPNTMALMAAGLAGLAFLVRRKRILFAPRT